MLGDLLVQVLVCTNIPCVQLEVRGQSGVLLVRHNLPQIGVVVEGDSLQHHRDMLSLHAEKQVWVPHDGCTNMHAQMAESDCLCDGSQQRFPPQGALCESVKRSHRDEEARG